MQRRAVRAVVGGAHDAAGAQDRRRVQRRTHQLLDRAAGGLAGRSPVHRLGGRVPTGHGTVAGHRDDRVADVRDERRLVPQARLRLLLHGDVAQDHLEGRPALPHRVHRHRLDREGTAVKPDHRRRGRLGGRAGRVQCDEAALHVRYRIRVHEVGDPPAEQVLPRGSAERPDRGRVHVHHQPVLVYPDRVGAQLHQQPVPFGEVGQRLPGLVPVGDVGGDADQRPLPRVAQDPRAELDPPRAAVRPGRPLLQLEVLPDRRGVRGRGHRRDQRAQPVTDDRVGGAGQAEHVGEAGRPGQRAVGQREPPHHHGARRQRQLDDVLLATAAGEPVEVLKVSSHVRPIRLRARSGSGYIIGVGTVMLRHDRATRNRTPGTPCG